MNECGNRERKRVIKTRVKKTNIMLDGAEAVGGHQILHDLNYLEFGLYPKSNFN